MTKRPLSTISFNTVPFLVNVCNSLVDKGTIETWAFIVHKAEEDTKKEHIHLLIVPCKPVNPVALRRLFLEPDLKVGKDLSCLPFQTSKIGDWLLYALHFAPYLLKKGITRVYSYNLNEIHSNECADWVAQVFHDAKEEYCDSRLSSFLERMRHGDSFGSILASGIVPPSQIVFYEKLYKSNSHLLAFCKDGFSYSPPSDVSMSENAPLPPFSD